MGRQVFRMGLANATRHEAGAASGTDAVGLRPLHMTRAGSTSLTSNNDMLFMPSVGTNSFNNAAPFYFARKQYFIPFYSGTGGELDRIMINAGGDTHNGLEFASGNSDGYKWSLFSSDSNTGYPSAAIIDTYDFEPRNQYSQSQYDVRSSGSRVTLTADTWYWLGFLGGHGTNGENVNFNCIHSSKTQPIRIPASSNPSNMLYWYPSITTFKTGSFTINSGTNKFVPYQDNYYPRVYFEYLGDSSNSNRWA